MSTAVGGRNVRFVFFFLTSLDRQEFSNSPTDLDDCGPRPPMKRRGGEFAERLENFDNSTTQSENRSENREKLERKQALINARPTM